ncbi:MAG: choice-of-anchor B domain-containing protein [Flavobacteriales bacterium]|jgi:choice-of-anchor B domain-containing protein
MKFLTTLCTILIYVSALGQSENVSSEELLQNQEGPFPCVNGMAGAYPCDGYDLQSHLTNAEIGGSGGNDCWGWTDPLDNKEYAIMGLNNGTAFIDISNPTTPVYLGHLATQTSNSLWRDVKVHANHAYIVSEAAGHGMQIFDLTRLRNVSNAPETFTVDAHFDGFGDAHNIAINEETGYAYPVGASSFSGGPIFINLANPLVPVTEGGYDGDGYTHDAQIVVYNGPDTDHTGKEIFFGSNTNTLTIVDIEDKLAPTQLARETYTGVAYTHQGWLTEDQKYYLMDDEIDENNQGINTRTLIWDVQDLDNPFYIGDFDAAIAVTDHNLYVHNGRAYQANYKGGLRVLDLTDVANANLSEQGYFDTYPENDNNGYDGAWSTYPYFPSGNIIISTLDRGLFIVKSNELNTDLVNLNLKMKLEGPFDNVSGLMSDNLRSSGNIPLFEPYSELGYPVADVNTTNAILNVSGDDAIVDWVIVEIRNSLNPSVIIDSQSALLQRDGDIISPSGIGTVTFDPVINGNVVIAIRHRNHFGVRTLGSFSTAAPIVLDFSNPSTNLFGTNPTTINSGTQLLIGGDANNDGQVNVIDKNSYWRLQNALVFDYAISRADFNMDGAVNSVDKNIIWRTNNSKVEQLD